MLLLLDIYLCPFHSPFYLFVPLFTVFYQQGPLHHNSYAVAGFIKNKKTYSRKLKQFPL
jgi:hypothetical protein